MSDPVVLAGRIRISFFSRTSDLDPGKKPTRFHNPRGSLRHSQTFFNSISGTECCRCNKMLKDHGKRFIKKEYIIKSTISIVIFKIIYVNYICRKSQ